MPEEVLGPSLGALCRHHETIGPRSLDVADSPARGANEGHEADVPRGESDVVRGGDVGGSEIGVEEVLQAGAGLHEVEEVAEGL